MNISRRQFLALTGGTAIASLIDPKEALSWGAIVAAIPTHQKIMEAAFFLLEKHGNIDLNKFPSLDEILRRDRVWTSTRGTGPDVEGKSPYSWHYYNPRLKHGRGKGPYATAKFFRRLTERLPVDPKSVKTAKAASWASHFLGDMHVPYHVCGMEAAQAHLAKKSRRYELSENVSGPLYLYDGIVKDTWDGWGSNWNFKHAIDYFCDSFPLKIKVRDPVFRDKTIEKKNLVDWFDPWYNTGYGLTGNTISGSHALWEVKAHVDFLNEPGAGDFYKHIARDSYFDPLWKNSKVDIREEYDDVIAMQVKSFATLCAERTRAHLQDLFLNRYKGICMAIRAVMTLLRGSMTAAEMTHDFTHHGNDEYAIKCYIKNTEKDIFGEVDVGLFRIYDNAAEDLSIRSIDDIHPGETSCTTIHTRIQPGQHPRLALICSGRYRKVPDLGYATRQFTITWDKPPKKKEPDPVSAHSLIVSDFGFGGGRPFHGKTKIDGVLVTLASTNTEPYQKTSFRNLRKGKTATVTFRFSRPITEFHLKVSRVRYDEFLNGFNIGNPSSLSDDLIRKKGKITVTRDKGDKGAGNLIWTGINTTVVRFNIGGPKGTALAVDQFAILPAP